MSRKHSPYKNEIHFENDFELLILKLTKGHLYKENTHREVDRRIRLIWCV